MTASAQESSETSIERYSRQKAEGRRNTEQTASSGAKIFKGQAGWWYIDNFAGFPIGSTVVPEDWTRGSDGSWVRPAFISNLGGILRMVPCGDKINMLRFEKYFVSYDALNKYGDLPAASLVLDPRRTLAREHQYLMNTFDWAGGWRVGDDWPAKSENYSSRMHNVFKGGGEEKISRRITTDCMLKSGRAEMCLLSIETNRQLCKVDLDVELPTDGDN